MLGLNFGEIFIVCFVLFTVVAAPYAGGAAERLAQALFPKKGVEDRTGSKPESENQTQPGSPPKDGKAD